MNLLAFFSFSFFFFGFFFWGGGVGREVYTSFILCIALLKLINPGLCIDVSKRTLPEKNMRYKLL